MSSSRRKQVSVRNRCKCAGRHIAEEREKGKGGRMKKGRVGERKGEERRRSRRQACEDGESVCGAQPV